MEKRFRGSSASCSSESQPRFCLNDYDVIGFDMDHTLVQYRLRNVFELIFQSIVNFLVESRDYTRADLPTCFSSVERFCTRGLVLDLRRGNLLKLARDGTITRARHGTREMDRQERTVVYGADSKFFGFAQLQKKCYHGNGYRLFENFFDMPAAGLIAQLIDIADRNGEPLVSDYTKYWENIYDALIHNFEPRALQERRGTFFPALLSSTSSYVVPATKSLLLWLQQLRTAGKSLLFVTSSQADFTGLLMKFCFGDKWTDMFDFIVTRARKPEFFYPSNKDHLFLMVTEQMQEGAGHGGFLSPHTIYSQGNSWLLEESIKNQLGLSCLNVVYFGDSPKSDIFPAHTYAGWHAVACLEDIDGERLLLRRHSIPEHEGNSPEEDGKFPLVDGNPPMVGIISPAIEGKSPAEDEVVDSCIMTERTVVSSTLWGSFFHEPGCGEEKPRTRRRSFFRSKSANDLQPLEKNSSATTSTIMNTYWADVIRQHARLAIPALASLTDSPISRSFETFSDDSLGFYPMFTPVDVR